MRIRSGLLIDSIQAEYILADGTLLLGNRNGGSGGEETVVTFMADEVITEVRGSTNPQMFDLLSQLTFITTNDTGLTTTHGPFGGAAGSDSFSVQEDVVAFYGLTKSSLIIAIGFYYIDG